MAKVWKPKYWDTKNPPDAGSRVFVGKANGASSYETISAGQTKRILQSNGVGNIFYGNVTVSDPLSPTLISNLPEGDYSTYHDLQDGYNFYLRLKGTDSGTIARSFSAQLNLPFNLREGNIGYKGSTTQNSYFRLYKPASIDIAVEQANKMTLYLNDSGWAVINLTGRRKDSTTDVISLEYDVGIVMNTSHGTGLNNIRAAIDTITDAMGTLGEFPVRLILSNEPSWQN